MLKEKYLQWERGLSRQNSDLAKVAKAYIDHHDQYLSLKALHALTLVESDLQSARYRLTRQHGFKFMMNPNALYEYRLIDIDLSRLPSYQIETVEKRPCPKPRLDPLWRLALGLDRSLSSCQDTDLPP
ncbi:hypothetical protein [Vibrio mediterranei]|uniref:hypothetical protein n=1 Tax=Vibrio mediterranei TaxID=689 RepID=UPI00148DC533|nr:hypothetical protein [Vibrio mediterranei]NOI25922.1 hypothetical protein [Vibrio mediterranei]